MMGFAMIKIKKMLACLAVVSLFFLIFSIIFVLLWTNQEVAYGKNDSIVVDCISHAIYFPNISKPIPNNLLIFPYSFEEEPNNSRSESNGLLESGKIYSGEANDTYDLYRILLLTRGDIGVVVNGHNAPGSKVALYKATNYPTPVTYSYSLPNHTLTYSNAPEGLYYITVYLTATPVTQTIYQMVITYPVATATYTSTPSDTSTPIPPCTVTPLPSHTPSPPSIPLTETPVTKCTFEAPGVGPSIVFPTGTAGHISANAGESYALTTAVSFTPIPPGYYQVTMYSYDDHDAKFDQIQGNESWYLRLKNEAGDIIATAGPSTDIPDGAGNNCQGTYLQEGLILVDTAVFAEAIHAAYPAPANQPNSVNPDYALLIPVRMVAPTPSRTPAPPHYATQTPTP